ncbi:MAG: ribosome biogenesis factor YjgA [Halothiobacillaceae bacterium]
MYPETPAGSDEEHEDSGPSKSERKRQATALQDLGERLVELSREQLDALPIGDALRQAILLAQTIRAHGGRRRQLQYIGKLMRGEDADAIRAALERLDPASPRAVRIQHLAESWRERLLAEGDEALAALVAEHPGLEVQPLRQTIRQARQERARGAPPHHYRTLFRTLRDFFDSE